MTSNQMDDLRKAGDIHRQVRDYIYPLIKPNMKIMKLCDLIENKITEITKHNDNRGGIAFPTGLSINNMIAHDTVNIGDMRTFKDNDICKIDFGVHINGRIIDSAFTYSFNDKYKVLIDATKDATMSAIKMIGPDILCNDVSKHIQEIIESYELEKNGKTMPIYAVRNLGGHSIDQYDIHSGKLILCTPNDNIYYKNMRLSCGQYAVETFATTGTGYYKESEQCSHYALNKNMYCDNKFKSQCAKHMYTWIKKNRGMLPFTPKWMENDPNIKQKYRLGVKELLDKKLLVSYPPIYDVEGSYSSQMEHTIYVKESGTEILSAGTDY